MSQSHAHICFLRDRTFFKFPPQSILTANLVHMAFSANSMSSKHPQNQIVHLAQGGFLSAQPQISKTSTFEVPKFSQSFLLFVSVGFCRGLPRAAAAEAKHRCNWQPSKATTPWSSGSSRRRRPWTATAVASEKDSGGKPLEAWDSL